MLCQGKLKIVISKRVWENWNDLNNEHGWFKTSKVWKNIQGHCDVNYVFF